MILLVYDVTNPASFANLSRWVDMFRSVNPGKTLRGANQHTQCIRHPIWFSLLFLTGAVVANKTDLDERAAVPATEGEAFAQRHELEFFQTSAKGNTNVDIPFMYLASQFKDAYEEQLLEFASI